MQCRNIMVGLLVLSSSLALTACATAASTAPTGTQTSLAGPTDETTCTEFGDVLTVIANADAGLRDGRMAVQEQQGWYMLASRVLDRVATREDGDVSEAIADLQSIAGKIDPGAMGTTQIGSTEWYTAQQALSDACTDAGTELAVQMFTGG